jgi:hypothetical protein
MLFIAAYKPFPANAETSGLVNVFLSYYIYANIIHIFNLYPNRLVFKF